MKKALFSAYPALESVTPALSFADLPTPIARAKQLTPELPGNLWIKRDDLSHPGYGGNKVRKLEFVLAEVLQGNYQKLATFGAIGTNHGVATAFFCRQLGLQARIYLFDQPITTTVRNNLLLMHALGAELVYCGSLFSAATAFYRSQLTQSRATYHLFAGGSNVAGCIGFVNAAFELKQQIDQGLLETPDIIVCPVGSSATLAGLTLGCALADLPATVYGVRVAPSHLGFIPTCTIGTVARLMQQTYRRLRRSSQTIPNITLPAIRMTSRYFGSGYGHALPAAKLACKRFEQTGLPYEQTYTAKTIAAALDLCEDRPDRKVLYWHTFNSANLSPMLANSSENSLPRTLRKKLQKDSPLSTRRLEYLGLH